MEENGDCKYSFGISCNKGENMKKPNFFIIGAPKCGTTSLAAWLSEHSNIYMSPLKEPHFFNTDGVMAIRTINQYERLFKDAGSEHNAVGEASTHYLFSKRAVPNILEYNPNAKLIVCLRNPVEMAPAHHSELLWQGRETVRDFNKAWHLQYERLQGNKVPLTARKYPHLLQYGTFCCLGEQLSRVRSYVSTDQLMAIVLDDMKAQPRRVYLKALSFLGLADDGKTEFPVLNKNKHTKSVLLANVIKAAATIKNKLCVKKIPFKPLRFVMKKNMVHMKREEIPTKLKAELIEYFKSDIQLLSKLIERDLTNWIIL